VRAHIYVHHIAALGRLDQVLQRVELWDRKEQEMSAQMDALVAKVAALHAAVDSAVAEIANLRKQLAEPPGLDAVIADLDAQGAELAGALAPPAPPVAPPADPPAEPPAPPAT
jgi:hypothetical protein